MKNFYRAIRKSCKYKWSLSVAMFSSLMVALLWGANMGAVYPFVEVILNDKSMHQWIDEKLVEAQKAEASLEDENAHLVAFLEKHGDGNDPVELPEEVTTANPLLSGMSLSELQAQVESNHKRILHTREKVEHYTALAPYIKKYLPDSPYKTLVLIIALLIGGTLIKSFFLLINMYLVAHVSQRTVLDLQNEFFRKTLRMDLAAFGHQGTGDLVGRIRSETKIIGNTLRTLYGKTLREPLKMLVCLMGAAWLNWRLLLFSMLICPLAAYLMLRLSRSIKRANRRALEESAKLLDRLFQAVTYIKIVRSNNMEAHERSRFAYTAKEVYAKGMKIALYGSFFRLNNEILGMMVVCMSVLAGGYLVLNHTEFLFGIRMAGHVMGFADLLLFYALIVGFSDPLRKMGDSYSAFQSGIVACDRIFDLMDRQPAIRSPRERAQMPAGPALLEFDNVSFAYTDDKMVLENVSFTLQPGESLAIVGANGCGKSTLVNLLPRFFDVTSGSIKMNGRDLREYSMRDLRRYMSMVTQQTMLFNDTISNNIRYGAVKANDKRIEQAAIEAHAHEFITRKLDQGYETCVGEHGNKLSGGQRQRIALARAILRDSPMLILDEATSQIDPESEQLIHQTLKKIIRGRSVIMITHRPSTLELADKIMLLESGRIVDFGTDRELTQRCEMYRRFSKTELRESA
jgi:ATP-binding cassette subfamily B protein/subfamily B ATP-binding cassette protein MsbA